MSHSTTKAFRINLVAIKFDDSSVTSAGRYSSNAFAVLAAL